MSGTILIVDDQDDTAELMRDVLRKSGFVAHAVKSARECLEHLAVEPADVVVTDILMPGMSGIDLCEQLRDRHPDLIPIVLTGNGDVPTAVAAIRAGAYDYLTKPVHVDALSIAITRALAHLDLKHEVKRLRSAAGPAGSLDRIAGTSPQIRKMIEMITLVARCDATTLITGESGTGKELVARELHRASSRREQPFVAINCAAMPGTLLESELFGHVRGAFTDAKQSRNGLIVQAGSGTIFLDEIGEIPLEMQVKLLRVLQEHTVRPVGGDEEIAFKARVIASTNRDLETAVAEKRFREDLFYRLNVVGITVPPLRDRAGDVPLLAQHFLERIAARVGKPVRRISDRATRSLADYDWPGNVRELENCMERAVALCSVDEICFDDLPTKVRQHQTTKFVVPTATPQELVTLVEVERRYILRVLQALGGNKTQAARALGIDRRSLYRRLDEAKDLASAGRKDDAAQS